MYNGVGLQTARGSGTSGYVQKSLAYAQQKRSQKNDYVEQLKKMRENPLPPPKPANRAILDHEARRREANRRFIKNKGLDKSKAKSRMLVEKVDTHLAKLEKEKAMNKIANAFNIDDNKFEQGAAFDIELQEMKRLERLAEMQEKKKERRREEKKRRRMIEEENERLRELERDDRDESGSNGDKKERSERSDRSDRSSDRRDRKKRKHRRKEKKDRKEKHKKHKRRRSHSRDRSD
ncbi:unnamed protein product [Moneuplotes crassus]|uniref:Pre-mRNA-splicing factor CWC21 n=1 Tax=Euplotes crassus TaxID=5936 RepID=A0AAD1XQR0_EUPCR|nr:unnamed protein product [Moneuplotes crassus]